jgi:hypothetical protein
MEYKMKRREALIGLGITSLAALTPALRLNASETQAPESHSDADHHPEYLFVQNSTHATLNNGQLRLKDVAASTVYFSDRPERIVGHVLTQDFVNNWDAGDDSFASNPPNAALSMLVGGQMKDIVVVLKNPQLDHNDLVYEVDVLDNGPAEATGTACALFIDVIGRPLTPLSVAGVNRRDRRRDRREDRR